MRLHRITLFVAVLLIALTPAACATSGAAVAGDALDVTFDVQNNTQGLTGVTVYIVTESGTRRNLGPVESNQRASFERSLRAGTYYLSASRAGSADLESERFRIDEPGLVVTWNMGQNAVLLRKR